MNATTAGIDLAKNVFEIALADERGLFSNGSASVAPASIASLLTVPPAASSWRPVGRHIITPDG
jgi:hypothetical protein